MKQKIEITFSAALLLVFAFAVFEARAWQMHARLLPWVIGFPMLILTISQLVLDIRRKGNSAEETKQATGEIPADVARRRAISILAWILGLFVAIWLLGFHISVPLFTFLYLKIESEETWWLAILLSVVAWSFLFGLFDWILKLPFPEGELVSWFGARAE
jgi:hypothetical protein